MMTYIELAASLATAIGFPLAILALLLQWRSERKAKEYESYNSLDEKYIAFIELCLQWPDLQVYDPDKENENWSALNKADARRQQMLYQILISILERAFLLYRDQSTTIKRKEYDGWHSYMQDYAATPNFRYAWEKLKLGEQFHDDFVAEMNRLISAP